MIKNRTFFLILYYFRNSTFKICHWMIRHWMIFDIRWFDIHWFSALADSALDDLAFADLAFAGSTFAVSTFTNCISIFLSIVASDLNTFSRYSNLRLKAVVNFSLVMVHTSPPRRSWGSTGTGGGQPAPPSSSWTGRSPLAQGKANRGGLRQHPNHSGGQPVLDNIGGMNRRVAHWRNHLWW